MSVLPYLSPALGSLRALGRGLVSLPTSYKVVVVAVSGSVALLGVLARYMRRRRQILDPKRYKRSGGRRATRASGVRSPNGDVGSSVASWSRRSVDTLGRGGTSGGGIPRPGSVTTVSERASVASGSLASGASMVQGDPVHLTPQQLGAMGVEALETSIRYWEDALALYTSSGRAGALLGAEESTFSRDLELLLDAAYQLQEQSEMLFLDQRSALFDDNIGNSNELVSKRTGSPAEESFASAVADLRDFDDLAEGEGGLELGGELYQRALKHLEEGGGIPCRTLRTELVGCGSDSEYLAKLHCLRLAFQHQLKEAVVWTWYADAGRQTLADMLLYADRDPKEFLVCYEAMLEHVRDRSNWPALEEELRARGVKALTFYDVVMDYILMDAFEDLESPPSSVTAVVQNRWLSDGFKETALATAVWSVLKAKRRLLKHPRGFMAHFYAISEQLVPLLAWGFLGPDETLRDTCVYFRDQVIGLLTDMFSFERSKYTTVEELSADLLTHFRHRVANVSHRLCANQ